MSNEADVDDLLNIMKDAVHCKKNKNVDILHLASQICRRMHGKLKLKYLVVENICLVRIFGVFSRFFRIFAFIE